MKHKRQQHISIKGLFSDLQEEMERALETTRKHVPHGPSKGTSSESRWTEWLKTYLPIRYQVQHSAFVVDARGGVSEQQDIVILDRQYTPFLFNHDGTIYIPAEGVYAVFEAKQQIDSAKVRYAGGKVASVRRMHRTSAPIPSASGTLPAKKPNPILGGFLALSSGWSKRRWSDDLRKELRSLQRQERLDLLCVFSVGAASIHYRGSEVSLDVSEEGLVFFFLRLLANLQKMATVPAIDFEAYARAISVARK